MSDEQTVGVEALGALRSARRRNRIANLEWFEALYRVYLTGFLVIVAVLLVSSWVGGERVSAETLADVERLGPEVLGLVAAVALAIGLRSGGNGGPLALEPAEVRYVLLAPVARRAALLSPALRQLRHGAFAGAVAGAVAGQLAVRRLGGSAAAWVASGALFGGLVVVGALGAALVVSGLRVRRWLASLLALVVLVWAVLALVRGIPAPTTLLGDVGLWPLAFQPWDLAAVVVVVALVVAGLRTLSGLSLEQAERRTGLVGQIRFAVTLQDFRTVMVLRRQLAQDRPRNRPWIALRSGRLPVWRRGWRGILRFPLMRYARMVVLGVAAGLCLLGAWLGTAPLVALAGVALFIAGLDAVEPLAQESDQSDRTDSIPVPSGDLLLRHLAVPSLVMVVVAALGYAAVVIVAAVAGDDVGRAASLGAILVVPAALGGAAGAVISSTQGSTDASRDGAMMPPEFAGMKIVLRTALPLIVAVLACAPVLAARAADRNGTSPEAAAVQAGLGALLLYVLTALWLRYREQLRAWWAQVLEEGQAAQRDRTAARKGTS